MSRLDLIPYFFTNRSGLRIEIGNDEVNPVGCSEQDIEKACTRMLEMANNSSETPNLVRMDDYIKQYPKTVFLIDEASTLSAAFIDKISDALCKTTNRRTVMGGISTCFLGDFGQLLPVRLSEELKFSSQVYKRQIVRQSDGSFQEMLDKVRNGNLDRSVRKFWEDRLVHGSSVQD